MENLTSLIDLIKPLGIPGAMAGLLGWLGKRYLDKKLESEKSENQTKIKSIESQLNHYLEIHKQKIKNSEFFFQKQYEASRDLYKIKSDMVPPYRFPDMDWDDAIDEMADDLEETGKLLSEFLCNYYTVLSPDIVEKLESAVHNSEEGSLYGREGPGLQCASSVYNRVKECTSLLKAEVDGQRLVEFHEYKDKNA